MVPALLILSSRAAELGIAKPWQFFWATGSLSSFLDNTPTYLAFFSMAQGLGLNGDMMGIPNLMLKAISVGAVFMGANSYIGNGPNFMVKAIAEEYKLKMPSFFGYMAYSAAVLVPLFVVVTLIFFR
jgi:Na+/H+ antiporter NhaD/arsenite permease-like protein